jgi:hypothetical protein
MRRALSTRSGTGHLTSARCPRERPISNTTRRRAGAIAFAACGPLDSVSNLFEGPAWSSDDPRQCDQGEHQ